MTRIAATDTQRARRVLAERTGRIAEWLAVASLWFRGYRVLSRRCRTGRGEIDIIAVRGRRLAFVEVKHRAALDDAADSVRPRQMARMHAAADAWVARHRAYQSHDRGFDAVYCAPGRLPVYAPDHLQPRIRRAGLPGPYSSR